MIPTLVKLKIQISGIPKQDRSTDFHGHVQRTGSIARMKILEALILGVVSLFTMEVDT